MHGRVVFGVGSTKCPRQILRAEGEDRRGDQVLGDVICQPEADPHVWVWLLTILSHKTGMNSCRNSGAGPKHVD